MPGRLLGRGGGAADEAARRSGRALSGKPAGRWQPDRHAAPDNAKAAPADAASPTA
jgi:hypothetical protein